MRYLIVLLALVLNACATGPSECCAPDAKNLVSVPLKEPTTKSYIVFNKKEFIKPRGLVTMARSKIYSLAEKFGEENMKPLETINGFTVKNAKAPITIASDEWVVQEEMPYRILETLYRHVPVETDSTPCPVCPKCPDKPCDPGRTCPPNDVPPVTPPGPIEVAKSWGLTRMKAIEAKSKVDTSKVKVCVVDTGIDMKHPNKGNVVKVASYSGEPVGTDRGQHGSHVSGTIAGTGGIGVSRAELYVCSGLGGDGSGSSSALAQCLAWCGQQGVQIVSNSWGGGGSDPIINSAIEGLTKKGIAVVVANGNDSRGTLNWPAQLSRTNPLVFGIAASDESDRKASFSTYGPGTKYIAPGTNIISNKPNGGTQGMSGTSMATPAVSGAMTYCLAMGKPVTCLKTDNLGLDGNQQGAGLPNLLKTVNQ